MIVPFEDLEEKKERKLGILDGKYTVRFSADFKMTEEQLVGLE